ncbi:putative Adenosine deaminase [Sorangium cellulosum So ce56]|uniref:adenosine deaminase n=1 Tax=Sorangium cellulosum (strain So ce56) TaxID=448385 RepID=A9G9G3_SORC5|nr:adenosine deaminase [Sorangium cellulosum]CAN99178.1 putative Adenosine deaminase [Sorangium cellulosum So ce56]
MSDHPELAGKLPLEFFRQLPKTDLHVHLDGSLRLETIIELARAHHVELPTYEPAELRRVMNLGQNCGSLVEYLKAFDITLRVLQTEEALHRVAYELAEDAARENVRYMEVRYSPMLHTRLGLRLTSVVEAVLSGLRTARDALGIESNVIVCGIRNISPESSLEMAELAVAYKGRGVVGFDLAGAEYDHPAKHHKAAFQLVRQNNINCTIHAGEAYGPESIAQALHVCGAHRIGHGCRLREDGDLLHYINDHRIPLECCPSSNVQTGAVRDLASHPLKLYQSLGLRVTVNTDNRLVTDTTVSHELWHCHTKMGFGLKEIKATIVAGFKSAFLPFHIKQAYLRRVTEDLERFSADGSIRPAVTPVAPGMAAGHDGIEIASRDGKDGRQGAPASVEKAAN